MKILILEDNVQELEAYAKFLKKNDFEVVKARNSREAFTAFRKFKDLDIFFCDINLELDKEDRDSKTNGIDVIEKQCAEYKIPVLFFSNNHDEPEYRKRAEKVLSGTPFAFVSKDVLPRSPNKLLDHLEELINQADPNHSFYPGKIAILEGQGKPYYFYSKDDIICLETSNGYTNIHLVNKKTVLVTGSLKAVFRQLKWEWRATNFCKVGRDLVVNIDHLVSIKNEELELTNEIKREISDAGQKSLKRAVFFLRTQ